MAASGKKPSERPRRTDAEIERDKLLANATHWEEGAITNPLYHIRPCAASPSAAAG